MSSKSRAVGRGRGTALKIYGILIFVFLYFPMVIVLLFSFSPTRTIVGLSGLTLRWYQELFQDTGLLTAFWHTVLVGLCAVAIATVFGTAGAFFVTRAEFPGKGVFRALVMLPFSVRYLQGFMSDLIKPSYSISSYVSFVSSILLWVGLSFETPLVIFFLAKLGIIDVARLSRSRKYAILIAAILAAVITPTPDPFNMVIVMGPLVILYELGVFLTRLA